MRRAALLLALCAIAAGGESKARLARGEPKVKVRRNYALPDGTAAVDGPSCRRAKVDKFEIFFFDVDGNGVFDDVLVDGWALPKMPYMLPFEKEAVIGRSVVSWRIEADGPFVRWSREPIPATKAQAPTLVQFNTWRFMNGLPGVTLDAALSDACARHCEYMERHGLVHEEVEGKEGYTSEGAEAGLRSCLSEDGPSRSVLMFYSSFYHRLPLIHPGTRAIGVANSRRYTAVDGTSMREPRAWTYPVIVPAPGSWFQPTHFARELPQPHPEIEQPGFPITLTFDKGAITTVKGTLRLEGAEGAPVPAAVSWPERPAHRDRPDNRNSILVLPMEPLRPGTTYWVSVAYRLDGQPRVHEWVFKTGKAQPIPRLR